jgi:hypothetical protein
VTGSFREAMIGGGAFILLKVDRIRPESAKQTEVRLASLLKILGIARSGEPKPSPRSEKSGAMVVRATISPGYG